MTIGGGIVNGGGTLEVGLAPAFPEPVAFFGGVTFNTEGRVVGGSVLPIPLPRLARPTTSGSIFVGNSLAATGALDTDSLVAGIPDTRRGVRSLAGGIGAHVTIGPGSVAWNSPVAANAANASAVLFVHSAIAQIENPPAGTLANSAPMVVEDTRPYGRVHPVRRLAAGRNTRTAFDDNAVYVAATGVPTFHDLVVTFDAAGMPVANSQTFVLPALFPEMPNAEDFRMSVTVSTAGVTINPPPGAVVPLEGLMVWRISNAGSEETLVTNPGFVTTRATQTGQVFIRRLTEESVSVEEVESLKLRFMFVRR